VPLNCSTDPWLLRLILVQVASLLIYDNLWHGSVNGLALYTSLLWVGPCSCLTGQFLTSTKVKVNVKGLIYSPDIPDSSAEFTVYLPRYWNSLSHGLISLGRMQRIFAVEVPPGTHYCWVGRGKVDSNLAQGLYTWPMPRESNPKPLALRSNTLPLGHALHKGQRERENQNNPMSI
jgi:hypothetical protein